MNNELIPFNRPVIIGDEIEFILDSIKKGWVSGDGPYTKNAQDLLQEQINPDARVLLTTSCTHALEMSAILIDISPGDEVIVPSFTFVSTALAFVMRGAKPVFADIRPDTLNMDENIIDSLITDKTRAIVPVHYAGVACEMDAIVDIAASRNLIVIEDNAHGLYGKYKGKNLGSIAPLATQSFHETKNIICGEGGALVMNDDSYAERAEIIREKGTDRSRFFRGQVDKYSWVDKGSSYVTSDILAAFLYAQLIGAERIQNKRKHIWNFYHANLQQWADKAGVGLPFVPEYCEQPYHMFYLLMPSSDIRTDFIKFLDEHNINSVFHYLPLHSSKMGKELSETVMSCPVADDVSDRLVRLPFFNNLTDQEMERVVTTVNSYVI